MRGRDQPHLDAERQQLPPPVMRRRAGLHRHHTLREVREKRGEPAARELARHHDLAFRVDGVNLKNLLRQIEPNARDRGQFLNRLAHGRLPFRWGFDNDHLGTLMPFGAPSTPSLPDNTRNGAIRHGCAEIMEKSEQTDIHRSGRYSTHNGKLRSDRLPSNFIFTCCVAGASRRLRLGCGRVPPPV